MNKIIILGVICILTFGTFAYILGITYQNNNENNNENNDNMDNTSINNPPGNPDFDSIIISVKHINDDISILYDDTKNNTNNITISIFNETKTFSGGKFYGNYHDKLIPFDNKCWVFITATFNDKTTKQWRFEVE